MVNLLSLFADALDLHTCTGIKIYIQNKQEEVKTPNTTYASKTTEAKLCDIGECSTPDILLLLTKQQEHNTMRQHSGDYRYDGLGILIEERYKCSLNYWNWSVIISENSCLTTGFLLLL